MYLAPSEVTPTQVVTPAAVEQVGVEALAAVGTATTAIEISDAVANSESDFFIIRFLMS